MASSVQPSHLPITTATSRFLWKVLETTSVIDAPNLHPIVAQLCAHRGLQTSSAIDAFLNPQWSQHHDPYLFRDMHTAVQRIVRAITANEKIVIHGDYDADGVSASAVLSLTLQKLGATVEVYLPHRDTEGYGLNSQTVQVLAQSNTRLIITVDCGISNAAEVAQATDLGMDVIVTDHHSEPPELPTTALAILNPKISGETYPFRYLAGVGVSYKLCQALLRYYDVDEAFEKWLLDLVAISTVTDCVELIGENRLFLRYGLVVMRKNRRPGLQALLQQLNLPPDTLTEDNIAFGIGPPINAAGRVKHANQAYELLVAPDQATADLVAESLLLTNRERQALSATMTTAALAQVAEQAAEPVLVAQSTDWPVGLVGLVAGRLTDRYQRPSFVITQMNNQIMGSGRSIEQFDLVQTLQSMPELFTKYGGHPMACGFSLRDAAALDEFIIRVRQVASQQLADKDLRPSLMVDAEIALPDVTWSLVESLQQCAPFGQANPRPLFCSTRVMVNAVSHVGKQKNHLRLSLQQGAVTRPAIGFGLVDEEAPLQVGQFIDIVYHVSVNTWNGTRSIQLELRDLRPSI